MLWLQLARVGCGGAAAILLGAGVDTSTDGESHAFVTYLGFYGAGGLLVAASIWLTIVIHGHKEAEAATGPKTRPLRWEDLQKMRVPIESDAHAESLRIAKRGARHIHAELDSIRKKVNDALTNGFWWNVVMEGLQSREWQRGKDALADEAPKVYDTVASVYVLADDMNAKANNHAQGGHDEFSDDTAAELRSLRSRIKTAQRALQKFFDAD
jgi:hypothetical protein